MRRTDLALAPGVALLGASARVSPSPAHRPDQACMDAEAGFLVNAYTPYRLQSH